ncbi:nuclear transport factor 2 family protein [uncultured Psychroserpens sp.]|uniref:nuclear transport factor 2 family protein n=1 Tax=uncultured Psychroserpens sp. TaxID=255436 RepID=UPI002621A7B2|nr:nuclear transport factor 2 family protein [uncultured Psychroserpens sp.]
MKKLIVCLAIASIFVSCDKTKKDDLKTEETTTKVNVMSEADKLAVESRKTLDIANAYMAAMGKGDMQTMTNLMHDDMVWQNAGDSSLPWMGPWKGKKAILEEFFPAFGAGFVTKKWEPTDAISHGDTAAYFGQMIGLLTNSNKETKEFTYALRVKVKDGKIILWNWFEDSFEVSKTYHAK